MQEGSHVDDALAALYRVRDGLRVRDVSLPDINMFCEQALNRLVDGQCPDGISGVAEGLYNPGAESARRACHEHEGFLIGVGHSLRFS